MLRGRQVDDMRDIWLPFRFFRVLRTGDDEVAFREKRGRAVQHSH